MTAVAARTVTITLPLPPSAVSPNTRAHWRARSYAARQYRELAHYAAFAVRVQMGHIRFQRADVRIAYTVCLANPIGISGRARPRDLDNAQSCMKSGLDGALVDSGLLPDDSARHVLSLTTTLARHGRRDCRPGCPGSGVVITVDESLP